LVPFAVFNLVNASLGTVDLNFQLINLARNVDLDSHDLVIDGFFASQAVFSQNVQLINKILKLVVGLSEAVNQGFHLKLP